MAFAVCGCCDDGGMAWFVKAGILARVVGWMKKLDLIVIAGCGDDGSMALLAARVGISDWGFADSSSFEASINGRLVWVQTLLRLLVVKAVRACSGSEPTEGSLPWLVIWIVVAINGGGSADVCTDVHMIDF